MLRPEDKTAASMAPVAAFATASCTAAAHHTSTCVIGPELQYINRRTPCILLHHCRAYKGLEQGTESC